MGIITKIEEGISNIIETPFSQNGIIDTASIEIALKRFIVRHKEVILGKTIIPNCYDIVINESLYDEYKSFFGIFESIIIKSLNKWIKEQGYTTQDMIHIHFKKGKDKKLFIVKEGDSKYCRGKFLSDDCKEDTILGRLVFIKTKDVYDIYKPKIIIGRANSCDIKIEDITISRRHACMYFMLGEVILEDLGSKSCVRVNRKKVTKASLKDGDIIRIGCVDMAIKFEKKAKGQNIK